MGIDWANITNSVAHKYFKAAFGDVYVQLERDTFLRNEKLHSAIIDPGTAWQPAGSCGPTASVVSRDPTGNDGSRIAVKSNYRPQISKLDDGS